MICLCPPGSSRADCRIRERYDALRSCGGAAKRLFPTRRNGDSVGPERRWQINIDLGANPTRQLGELAWAAIDGRPLPLASIELRLTYGGVAGAPRSYCGAGAIRFARDERGRGVGRRQKAPLASLRCRHATCLVMLTAPWRKQC